MGYWDCNNKKAVSVTNKKNLRVLNVVAPEGTSKANPVIVSQKELAPLNARQYEISFNGYANVKDGLTVNVAGKTFTPELSDKDASYAHKFVLDKNVERKDSNVEFVFTKPGEYYIDNAFLAEAALLKNGSFNAGLAGFTPYIYDSVKANYVIDNMNGNDNAFAITIDDTVADTDDNCWYIQLNQDGIKLEKGKKYRVSFKAKSSIDRVIKYSLQEFEGNWTNYSGTGSVEIGNDWKTFTQDFVMESETDPNTRFNITMGSVDGIRITDKHDIYIDDISLIELTDENEQPKAEPAKSQPQQAATTIVDNKTPLAGNTSVVNNTAKTDNKAKSGEKTTERKASTTEETTEETSEETSEEITTDVEETKESEKEESVDSNKATEEKIEKIEEPETAKAADKKEQVGFFGAIINFFKAIIEFFKSLFS